MINGSSIIIVDEIVSVVLSNKLEIFQRKQSSQKCKTTMESLNEHEWRKVYRGFLNYAKLRVSRQIFLHEVNNLVHLFVRKLACTGFQYT